MSSSRPRTHLRLAAAAAVVLLAGAGIALGGGSERAAAATVAPIASYSFESDSGATVVDGSGHGNDATWKGTPAYVISYDGSKAISVSAGANYIKLPLVAGQTDGSGSFSYEFWMKEASRTSYGPIVSNQNFAHCYNKGFTLYNQATQGVLEGCWGKAASTNAYLHGGSANLGTTAWHHIAVSVDTTAAVVTFYVDGVKSASSAAGDVTASSVFNSGLAFNIGGLSGSETDTSDGYTNASIDNFSFYNAAIGASQVASDYAATLPPASYTVAFDGNGSTSGATASEPMVSNQAKALTANGFARTGYLFAGWATSASGRAVYKDGQSVTGLSTTPGATVTLYAVWNRVRTAADTVAPIISLDFDADTGATASDSSGNGYNATWSGTSSYSSGVSGKAAYVNAPAGSSGPVNFLSLPMLTGLTDGSSSFSYEFWMKEVSATVDAEVVSNQDFAHCYNKGASFYNTSGSAGILRGCYGQNGSSTTQHYLANATPSSIVGAWHHLAVVVDRSAGTMTTYADGVQTVKDTNLTSAFSLISGYPFRIGSDGTGTNTSDGYLNAYIDDFDFFAAAVPASQISADYLATKPATGVAYTVAFDANGATSGSMSPEAMVSDTAKALTANAFTRTGYGFGGWATSPGGPVAYADRQSVTGLSTTPGATVTLYAIWNPYRATGDTIAPTLRYDFDADSGTSVVDGSGGSLGGTWVGTPAYVDGVTGRAASMSGGANYVKLPLKAGLTDASGSFSYSFWMQEQSRTSYGPFVSNQDFVSCNNAGLSIYNQATQGVLEACWGQSAGGTREYIHGGSGVLTGAWHYLSVVVDRAANTLTLYVDGTQTATQPTGSVTASTLFTSGLAFNIGGLGGSETDTSDGYSNFWVDDFDYYAAAVPAAQIANDWAATRPAAIHYTIAFDGNGATDGSMPPQQMTSYTPAPLATNAFVRPGYSFGGWATTPGGDATYADRQSVSDLTATADATVTLYAVWMRIQPSDAGFITDTFRAPAQRAGAAVSQPVGELWNGGAVAGYLKVAGASWLTVGSDGTVSGTAPADVPSEPATITVQATDGTTTSQLTLEVPVVASGTAPPLATVTWNLWDDGTHADNATRKALGAIAANGFDVIGVQEDGGVGALALAHALGWYGAEGAGGVGIVSAYPIDAASVTGAQGAPAVGVTVDVLGQSMRVWSVGLDATGYGPAAACTPGASADAVLAAERASLRYAQAQTIARAVAVDTASAASTPVVVLGDLESPSSSDWTAASSSSHCGVGAVDWPVPDAFARAGLTDSFRAASTAAGATWSPIVPAASQDRIDYVDYAGASLSVVGSSTFVTGWPSALTASTESWTSDHRAVVTLFRVGSGGSGSGGGSNGGGSGASSGAGGPRSTAGATATAAPTATASPTPRPTPGATATSPSHAQGAGSGHPSHTEDPAGVVWTVVAIGGGVVVIAGAVVGGMWVSRRRP